MKIATVGKEPVGPTYTCLVDFIISKKSNYSVVNGRNQQDSYSITDFMNFTMLKRLDNVPLFDDFKHYHLQLKVIEY